MGKYIPKTKHKGTYHFAGHEIEMSKSVARNKEARISYIMGYLAAKGNEELQRYEARRERLGLPMRPFNAGWRNNSEQNLFSEERPVRSTDPNYWSGKIDHDLVETIRDSRKHWGLVSDFFKQMEEYN